MSKFIKRQNNLRKAQVRFDKVSKRSKQFQIRYERSANRKGKFRTKARIVREEKTFCGNNRGLIHKAVNLKHRIKGDTPSITKRINSFQPKTFKGKTFKRSAQAVNFIVHDAGKTAVDTALAGETLVLKGGDVIQREVRNKLKQEYTRNAVDDYHRGTLESLRIGADAVKGTHKHFKQKKQHKFEKAKFKLKKAEYDVFKHDTYKPQIKSDKSDLKSAKANFKEHKQTYMNSNKSNTDKAFLIRRKQRFKAVKREVDFKSKKLKTDRKFKRKELRNQRKIANDSATGLLALKPVTYTADRMKASAWQRAVNEEQDNDFVHALDSAKRRVADPTVQNISKPERLQRERKKRDSLSDKEKNARKRLSKQENRLKSKSSEPHKKRKKPKFQKSFSEKFKDIGKMVGKFIKNVYEKEVKKFFASIAVPILIILLVFAFLIMIFSSISGGGGFTLGTYAAQDYDLSEAERYYTQFAWEMNESVIKVGSGDWKEALDELYVDTSGYTDTPDSFIWGRSSHFNYDAVYDFDVVKLWGFLCAYYYDFDADNGDVKYWRLQEDTKVHIYSLLEDEYEFQHFYDNASRWEEYDRYTFEGGIDGSYWLVDSSDVYRNSFKPKSNPGVLNAFKDNDGFLHINDSLEILDAQHDFNRTGWYVQDQRYFVNDRSGQSSEPFYAWYNNSEFGRTYGDEYHPRSYWGFSETDQIYWCGSPQDTVYWRSDLTDTCLISFYNANYWKNDCRLYYNVKQKKTFDEVIIDRLSRMPDSEERLEYYKLLIGAESATLHGNHQTLKSLTGVGIHESTIINGFGYDMQGWNCRHCQISDLHEGIDIAIGANKEIHAPFSCTIKSYDSEKKTVALRKDDVEYWYDGTGGTERDTEVTITNVTLKSGYDVDSSLSDNEVFAFSTSNQYCDGDVHNSIQNYIHVKVEIDTDGSGWDFIDPRLVLY